MGFEYSDLMKEIGKAKKRLGTFLPFEPLSEGIVLGEKSEESAVSEIPLEDWLPTIRISENFGELRTKDRKLLDLFMQQIHRMTGESGEPMPGLEGKIIALSNFMKMDKPTCPKRTISQLFARIVALDIFGSILHEFTEAAGGFIMEAFFAALSGKSAYQMVEKEAGEEGEGKPIVDVVGTSGQQYSMKLLRGFDEPSGETKSESGSIKGSVRNLLLHFVRHEQLIYLMAYRDGGTMVFERFIITRENLGKFLSLKPPTKSKDIYEINAQTMLKWFSLLHYVQTFRGGKKYDLSVDVSLSSEGAGGKVKSEIKEVTEWAMEGQDMWMKLMSEQKPDTYREVVGDFISAIRSPMDAESLITLFDARRGSGDTKTQFDVSRAYAQGFASGQGDKAEFSRMDLSPGSLQKAAQQCTEALRELLIPFYEQVKALTDNANIYFLSKNATEKSTAASNLAKIVDAELPSKIDLFKGTAEEEV
jgi:hypothetical protein